MFLIASKFVPANHLGSQQRALCYLHTKVHTYSLPQPTHFRYLHKHSWTNERTSQSCLTLCWAVCYSKCSHACFIFMHFPSIIYLYHNQQPSLPSMFAQIIPQFKPINFIVLSLTQQLYNCFLSHTHTLNYVDEQKSAWHLPT